MQKNKIGLVLAYKGTNYGMHLQGYAIQQLLDDLGFKTEIIDYQATGIFHGVSIRKGIGCYLFQMFKSHFLNKKNIVNWPDLQRKNNKLRQAVSDDFRKSKLHNIVKIDGYNNLRHYASECSAILIGSDQMWLPGVCFGNFLSLRFVPENIKKISYATSLGVSSYPKYQYSSSRSMWNRIEFLSTREQEGKNVINEICPNKDVKVVVDPTYLFSKEQWLEKIPFERKFTDKYVLCYFLGNNDRSKESAQAYARKRGLKIVSILSNESYSEFDIVFCDEVVIGATISDFVNLIRGAECVFTDSFHGLAFSVINEKQFYIYYRKRDDAVQSRNSRIDNILRLWNLSDRLVLDNRTNWTSEDVLIDYQNKVTPKVKELREDSLIWLQKALNS